MTVMLLPLESEAAAYYCLASWAFIDFSLLFLGFFGAGAGAPTYPMD